VARLATVADGKRVEPEHFSQHPLGRVVDGGTVDPREPVVAVEQCAQLLDRARLGRARRDPMDAHADVRYGPRGGRGRSRHHVRCSGVGLGPGLGGDLAELPLCP
jgi:hypothetical protein